LDLVRAGAEYVSVPCTVWSLLVVDIVVVGGKALEIWSVRLVFEAA
jgi:hypothetical protein